MRKYIIYFKPGVQETSIQLAISGCRAIRNSIEREPNRTIVTVQVPDGNASTLEDQLDEANDVTNWLAA